LKKLNLVNYNKKGKIMSTPKDIEPIEEEKKKLLKLKRQEYKLKDLELVFEKLDNGENHQQISNLSEAFSTRQVKLVRFVYQKGTNQDIELLKSCQFKISSIKRYIQAKQLASRYKDPVFKLAKIMEQGRKKGSLTKEKRH